MDLYKVLFYDMKEVLIEEYYLDISDEIQVINILLSEYRVLGIKSIEIVKTFNDIDRVD